MNFNDASPSLGTRRIICVVTLALLGFSACSGDSSGQESDQAPASETDTATGEASITIVDFAFGAPLTVEAGTTVRVVNDDGAAHTLTADDGSFDTGAVDAGESTELTLDEAGEFAFSCDIHSSMTGSITVTG